MTNAQMLEYRYDSQQDSASWGRGLVVGGEVLLWMNFLPLMCLYQGIRDGSEFWTWWLVIESVTGLLMMLAGWWMNWRVS